jgi:hypothetical protein
MFVITPINDKNIQEKYAAACDVTYRPEYFAYAMYDKETGDIMGMSQFEIMENGGYISDLRPRIGLDDTEAMFILGRATMNFIDLCGKHTCRIRHDGTDARLASAIGFKLQDNGELWADMTDMFSGHCNGEQVKL